MKRNLLFLLAFSAAFVSCNLTTTPEDSLTPENYFKSEAALQQWLTTCYTQFDSYAMIEMDNDDVMDNSFTAFFGRTRQASTETWSWTMLRRINYFLEHSSICEDKEAANYYNALARFHRAYFYFEKIKKYGDVMWYDQVIGSTDEDLLYKPRDSRQYVVGKMLEDLDVAIATLTESKNEMSSNVTKWTALAVKARICLFEASFRKYHDIGDYESLYRQCVDACTQIMESGKFSLYKTGEKPYQDLFTQDPAPSCEAILSRVYNSNLSLYHSITKDAIAFHQGLSQRFVNHYLMKDGSYVSSQADYEKMDFQKVFKNRDPRMAQTVWGPDSRDKAGNKIAEAYNLNAVTGYFPIKFAANVKDISNRSEDIALIRYAEILLDYAEAKAELGEFTDNDAEKSINLIRARVGMPKMSVSKAVSSPDPLLVKYYPNASKYNPSNVGLILEIRRERTVELVMEGQRQWDIIRWCEGASIDNSINPFYGVWFDGPGVYDLDGDGTPDVELYKKGGTSSGKTEYAYQLGVEIHLAYGDDNNPYGNIVAFKGNQFTFQENRDYLWPIPAAQRALSKGTLTQNPNWIDGITF